jgi:pimeloyl-ACP methyl ester carboxylesterase
LSNLERNGARLYYEVNGVGPPVLFTHGFAATSRIWHDQGVALASRNTIIAWDMRGHGRSRVVVDDSTHSEAGTHADEHLFGVDETLDDMAAILDELGHDRAVIGGHSLGGYMALAFYQKYPERVRALLLLATGPGYRSDEAREKWNTMAKGLGHRIEKNGLEELQKLDHNMDPGEHESALELGMAARGMLVQRNSQIIDSLADIRVPTLVVVGKKDRGYVTASNYMVEKIPNAELISIPNAGHALNLHQPELFNTAAHEFLDRVA